MGIDKGSVTLVGSFHDWTPRVTLAGIFPATGKPGAKHDVSDTPIIHSRAVADLVADDRDGEVVEVFGSCASRSQRTKSHNKQIGPNGWNRVFLVNFQLDR